jgi:hypothetical protein
MKVTSMDAAYLDTPSKYKPQFASIIAQKLRGRLEHVLRRNAATGALQFTAAIFVTCVFAPLIMVFWLAAALTKTTAMERDRSNVLRSVCDRGVTNEKKLGVPYKLTDEDQAWIAEMEDFDRF